MPPPRLHHVTLMSTDLDRSVAFLTRTLGLERLERPPFPVAGAWLAGGDVIVHVNLNPRGTYRPTRSIDADDIHFAIRVDDFEAMLAHLLAAGFHETDDEADPDRILVKRTGMAGFPQLFVMDPDGHVIEINADGASAQREISLTAGKS